MSIPAPPPPPGLGGAAGTEGEPPGVSPPGGGAPGSGPTGAEPPGVEAAPDAPPLPLITSAMWSLYTLP